MTLALSKPAAPIGRGRDLRVALRQSGGSWDWSWSQSLLGVRLRVDEVVLGVNEEPHRAEITVNTAGWSADGVEYIPALALAEVSELIDPGQRCAVYYEQPESALGGGAPSRAFLFEGFLSAAQLAYTGEAYRLRVLAEPLLERLATVGDGHIVGRHVGYLDVNDDPQSRIVSTMPCVFNWQGRPNRHPDLFTVDAIDNVPLFTFDGDPAAVPWKIADVLTYLLRIVWPVAASVVGIIDGNGVSRCADVVNANGIPVELTGEDDPTWSGMIASACPELAIEGLDIVSALNLWCRTGGFRMSQHTLNAAGDPDTQLLFWIKGEGGPYKTFGDATHEREVETEGIRPFPGVYPIGMPEAGTTLSEVEPLAETDRGEIVFDSSTLVTACTHVGDPERFEVTVGRLENLFDQLLPLWAVDTTFGDNIAAGETLEDHVEAINTSVSDGEGTLFDRYDRRGALNYLYRYVGRVWGINESREYKGQTLERSNGSTTAWTSPAYDFAYNYYLNASVPKHPDPDGGPDLDWVPRRRPIGELLSAADDGGPATPLLECSWDAGGHWYPYPGNWRAAGEENPLLAQCAVVLTDVNLGAVKNEHPQAGDATEGQSVWEAIVRGRFRLALTCSVEGDGIVYGQASALAGWGTHSAAALTASPAGEMGYERLANSVLDGAAGWSFAARDDRSLAASRAQALVRDQRVRPVAATIALPWLSNEWLPGDLCNGIEPRGIKFPTSGAGNVRWPEVVRTRLTSGEGGQQTEITFDDLRTAKRK